MDSILIIIAITILLLANVWHTVAGGGHSVLCTAGIQLAAALANPDISTVRIETDITLSDDDWKGLPVPVILRRNLTVLGSPENPPLLDLANLRGKVQLQDGASFTARYLVIAGWRVGSWRQAPGLDLMVATPPGQVSVLRWENCSFITQLCYPVSFLPTSGPRPASIPGNNTVMIAYPSPATCSNSTCARPLERCYAYIALYEDLAIEGRDIESTGRTVPNGYIFHLRYTQGLCQKMMAEDCIVRFSPIGCALLTLAQPDASQSSGTPANGSSGGVTSSGSNATEKCIKGLKRGRMVGAVVGGTVGGAILILIAGLVLVRLRKARRHKATVGADVSTRCHKGVIGSFRQQVIEMGGALSTGCFGPCGPKWEIKRMEHGHLEGCGDCHDDLAAVSASQPAIPDDQGDSPLRNEVAATSATANERRPGHLGQSSTSLAGCGATAISSLSCPMQPVTLQTPNRADLDLVVIEHTTEQNDNKHKVTADGAAHTPHGGVNLIISTASAATGTSSAASSPAAAAAAPANTTSNVVTLTTVVLGKGAFGRVYKGLYRGNKVAVKVIEHEALWGPTEALLKVLAPMELSQTQQPTPGLQGPDIPAAIHHELAMQQQQPMEVGVDGDLVVKHGGSMEEDGKHGLALDDHALLQLQREVEVLGRCDHPNVVRLLGACLTPPRMCLVMELAETSLEQLLSRRARGRAPLPLDTVLHIAVQIAQGLEYLHPTIVHRDLKPDNVLINGADLSRPVAKLSDFGLSRLRSVTQPTMTPDAGTPAYMAPECYDVDNYIVTRHADMYSFGVLLWTMLTGQTPWQGLTALEIAYSVALKGQRLPMHTLSVHRCPPKLRDLICQCWEADPWRRPAAAEAVKELQLLAVQLQTTATTSATTTTTATTATDLITPSRYNSPNHACTHDYPSVEDTLDHCGRQVSVPCAATPYDAQNAGGSCQDACGNDACSIVLDLSLEALQFPDAYLNTDHTKFPTVPLSVDEITTAAVTAAAAVPAANAATTGNALTMASTR